MTLDEAENTRMEALACTQEEIELNRRLYAECVKEAPDFDAIEALLELGADPLGALGTSGDERTKHVYGEIISDTLDDDSAHLPRITALFLAHGMDVDHPRIPYDHEESLNPMWDLAFALNENALRTLEMLLDKGLSSHSAALLWEHALTDLVLAHADPVNDEFWLGACTWTLKAMMLCASYEHIGGRDESLRKVINCAQNSVDLCRFRSWNDFDYRFSASPDSSIVARIVERESKMEVWSLQIGGIP